MFKKSLHARLLVLIMGVIALGVVVSILVEYRKSESDLLDEKIRASRYMASPILNSIYEDMLEERADMARNLISALGRTEGIESLYILRSNGREAAFRDLKTIREVEKEYGKIKPEWVSGHPDEAENVALGVDTPEFKEAFASFKSGRVSSEINYIDRSGPEPILAYLKPIEKKPKCNSCHVAEGARGIIVIRTSLKDMYASLAASRRQWVIIGFFTIGAAGLLFSMIINQSVTGPIGRTVEVIKRITGGTKHYGERVEVTSEDEIGYFARAFNDMLDTIEKRDIENQRLFDLVKKSKEQWVATFDAIEDIISIHDADCRILRVNKAFAAKLDAKPEELVGKSCYELLFKRSEPCEGVCPHRRCLSENDSSTAEFDDMAIEGTYEVTAFPVFDEAGKLWASVHIARDVTEERMLRDQLLHTEKLSSVGKLVAGIAHELNNPLMGIMGFSQILMDTSGEKTVGEIKPKIEKIYKESLRTSKIVQNLLTFARAKKSERGYYNINVIIRQTFELRAYSLKANNIEVATDLADDLPSTMVDMYQMQQVFVNIVNNAEDAILADSGGGRIDISTRLKEKKIEVVLRDDGPGIPKDILGKVFDPFFTTKEVGKGTGLGLSIIHGIITEHGGGIRIESPEEGGTLVTITLPVVKKAVCAGLDRAVGASGPLNVAPGARVLIVDDEESIRETLSDIFTRQGFEAVIASDGREALMALERDEYTLVLSDVRMSGLDGTELYDTVVRRFPYLKGKVIMLTGDVFSERTRAFLETMGCPYILKPFELDKLLDLIRKVLS